MKCKHHLPSSLRVLPLFILAISLSISPVFAGPLDDCKEYTAYGVPGNAGDLLCRKGFLLAHDPERKTPIWVVEHLTKKKAMGGLERKDNFKADDELAAGKRAELTDYESSGYDRGHMAPSADMRWDKQAMAESCYLSNVVPQIGRGMNNGIWKVLEGKVRDWAKSRGEVYVFTGPVYASQSKPKTIGDNKVGVPASLYKIVFDPDSQKAIAFLMPNKRLYTKDLPKYIVSVREVEKATGLNFFTYFSQPTQDYVETKKAPGLWQ